MSTAPSLSRRLAVAADFVRDGSVTADVGCDHGKLSAFLLDSGKAEFVYATDIRKQPLEKAAALLSEERYRDRYECILTDGLQGLPGDRITDVVIAGVGDDVTEKIITEAPWLCDSSKRLILVPSSRHERVRCFLASEGFETLSEKAVCEKGHSYTVILAQYSGDSKTPDTAEKWIGKIDCFSDDGRRYTDTLGRRLRRVTDGIRDVNDPARKEAAEVLDLITKLKDMDNTPDRD